MTMNAAQEGLILVTGAAGDLGAIGLNLNASISACLYRVGSIASL